ncbi:ABC transporter ATP-binding protein [Sulfitobacter pseudonitzschiae]|uniref:ABC transporter ATP-binding protein n=1 Tax=Pseudosulfitobacter pseudonitzschiae TaxID=1402135 RepID=A0A9Q2NL71_9RHOB|nr:ABC transporter ATP-binding protein [Pseudosulfitobacter pseudonitzschiae]MBM2291601.1 ABC transporter ATP-binding protein [Pseudosulfitobacter pseudonitzschiae]MBM2296519.1 ABC transporter ATP-binding protein [Pseudosulfitobacter pseudonitzschiae]MBM2301432.1 ABC transporter ATP-binding protein [Pseudosulfitobacter pseudonitzschiae]MBM2311216.1 ABC transporter ATP-binding protein [Pseudosulfitobacter pseudonitzschiae]MBM2316129.1 ABC transporter ATP-binding protein [Pseudosulfitobacter pse
MTLLELDNIVVEFPTRRGPLEAVKGLSLELDEGQILGLVGESGAGKSITGAAITGLIEPPGLIRSGQVRLRGQRIDNLAPEKMRRIRGKEIGAIFQDPLTSLNPVYTVGEQLIDTMRVHLGLDHKAARKRAIDWLAEVGIPAPEARLDQYPHQFSGGMRQRVVIALALCAEPKLIIADEPTTALDVSVQAQILALLKRLCRENGTAVVLVTHDMGVIAETADRVAVMYAGRLVEIGDVAQVIQDPLHPYTRGLMNSIPQIGNRDARLTQIEGAMPGLRNPAPGCAFAPRCPQAMDTCRTLRPLPVDAGSGQVACHLFGEVQ